MFGRLEITRLCRSISCLGVLSDLAMQNWDDFPKECLDEADGGILDLLIIQIKSKLSILIWLGHIASFVHGIKKNNSLPLF